MKQRTFNYIFSAIITPLGIVVFWLFFLYRFTIPEFPIINVLPIALIALGLMSLIAAVLTPKEQEFHV